MLRKSHMDMQAIAVKTAIAQPLHTAWEPLLFLSECPAWEQTCHGTNDPDFRPRRCTSNPDAAIPCAAAAWDLQGASL